MKTITYKQLKEALKDPIVKAIVAKRIIDVKKLKIDWNFLRSLK